MSSLDDRQDWLEYAADPQQSGLRAMLATELSQTKTQWLDLVANGDSELLDYFYGDYPDCTVRRVLYGLGFKEPPETLTEMAIAFGINPATFYRFYQDHVQPRAQALLLAPNLLTPGQAAEVIEEIDGDFHGVLQRSLNSRMPLVTVQFMAQQYLWLYHNPPLSFGAIAELGRERFGYKKLTAELLEDFWWKKCQQPLAKIVGVIFCW